MVHEINPNYFILLTSTVFYLGVCGLKNIWKQLFLATYVKHSLLPEDAMVVTNVENEYSLFAFDLETSVLVIATSSCNTIRTYMDILADT